MHRTATLPDTPKAPPAGLARALLAARVVHPFPTLLNVAATAALAAVAWRGDPPPALLARLLGVMLLAQCAIGTLNDYVDRGLDARSKPWKPLVAGYLPPPIALAAGLALAAAALALAGTLGPAGFALAALGLACGLAYDLGLKRSAFSALPYMVAIPTLPIWVWAVAAAWRGVLWWLVPLGALLGLAVHLANTLPDIDADSSCGVRGLAHRFGARCSMAFAWLSFAAALALSAAIAPFASYDLAWYLPAAAAAAACLAASIAIYALRRDAASLQIGFGLLGAASAIIAAGWLAAVTA